MIGGVLVVVTWLYFASIVVLLGAALNAVLADRIADEHRVSAREPGA